MSADRDGKKMLLAHIIRLPEVAQAACTSLVSQNPFEDYDDLSMIFSSANEYWRNFGRSQNRTISMELLLTDLGQRLAISSFACVTLATLAEVVRELYSFPVESLDKMVAASVLTDLRDEKILGRVRDLLNNGADFSEASDALNNASKQLGISVLSRPAVIDQVLGENFLQRIVTVSRDPTGIPFIDTMLGGGLAPGEKICFVIPPGCGKTTLGLQISDAKVTSDMVVAYVQTEQELDGDLQQRICTLAAGSSKNTWEKLADSLRMQDSTATPEKYLKPQEYDRFLKMIPKWNQNFWFFDFTDAVRTPIKSVDEIFAAISEKEAATGRKVHMVIIDWWGRIADRFAANSRSTDGAESRRLGRANLDKLRTHCQFNKYQCVVMQQMTGAAISQKKASATNAHEDKSFPQLFDYAFALTQLNDRGEGIMQASKVRRGSRSSVKVFLDGEYAKFKGLDEAKKNAIGTMKQAKQDKDVYY